MKSSIFRALDLKDALTRKSVLLLGPRQVGKSTLIATQLGIEPDLSISLLDQSVYLDWASRPALLRERIAALKDPSGLIVIDEIQRLPGLLNEIHLAIESLGCRFLLTGSSARKLKRQGVNLLGGRALRRELHPLTAWELGTAFNLTQALSQGLLPSLYDSLEFADEASAYVGTYLTEEISAEGISRNLPAFVRFLEVAAHCHCKQINFSTLASDVGVSRVTIQNYFQVLVDTLIGTFLEPYRGTTKRKAVATPKFYLFDAAVVRTLRRLGPIAEGAAEFGDFFEHLVHHHLRAYISYRSRGSTLHYWRSTSQFEVDFILDGSVAIECKATRSPQEKHLAGLKALQEEGLMRRQILVCLVDAPLRRGDVDILPVRTFLDMLWDGGFKE